MLYRLSKLRVKADVQHLKSNLAALSPSHHSQMTNGNQILEIKQITENKMHDM